MKAMAAGVLILLMLAATIAAQGPSPLGRWRTIDDATNTARSILEIAQVGDELLLGCPS
jgi:hypothetical protein